MVVLISFEGDCDIDVWLFQYGDYFRFLLYFKVFIDGVVLSGKIEVDELMFMGELMFVVKQ